MQSPSQFSSFEPNTLAQRVRAQSRHALECGALLPIPTHHEWVEDGGLRFLVRIVDNLRRKSQASKALKKAQKGGDFNPFLPYEPDLFVSNISETHLVLLNKFNVMDDHFLIVTRDFESQESWLTLKDFEALWQCLFEIDGLGFYNGGPLAGSSQRHKHLQVVPTPLANGGPRIPIEPLIEATLGAGNAIACLSLPFDHVIVQWPLFSDPLQAAQKTHLQFIDHLQQLGFGHPESPESPQPLGAYNLLMTRRWMMIVPRSREKFEKISINSLGFSGAMLVRDAEKLLHLKNIGPMTILRSVGVEKSSLP